MPCAQRVQSKSTNAAPGSGLPLAIYTPKEVACADGSRFRYVVAIIGKSSGRQDSNLRPLVPQISAHLPELD
jgi:hypothetical protein